MTPDLTQMQDIIAGAQSLKVLGYAERLYDVSYQDGEAVVSGEPWPLHKIVFRQDENVCGGWEWLLKHEHVFRLY